MTNLHSVIVSRVEACLVKGELYRAIKPAVAPETTTWVLEPLSGVSE